MRVRSVQLKISSTLVVCVAVKSRVPTAPQAPSWPPSLADETGILETSRILRYASCCAPSCQQAAEHFCATTVQRNVCPGVRHAGLGLLSFGSDLITTPPAESNPCKLALDWIGTGDA